MDLSVLKKRSVLAISGLMALTIGAGTMQANVLTATSPVVVTCNTATGPGAAASITIKPSSSTTLTPSTAITVTFVAPSGGIVVTAPATTVLSSTNQTAGIVYTVNAAPGCVGNSTGATVIQFKAAVGVGSSANDATVTANDTVTVASSSGLVASNVAISCTLTSGPVYTPGPAQTVSVSSTANGGTPFTVTNPGAPSWLTVSSLLGGTAAVTPVTFTVQAVSPCGSLGSYSTTLHLVSTGGGPDKLVTVTLQVVPPSPLTVTPVPAAPSISLSYTKGSGNTATTNVSVTSTVAGAFFTVNAATLPIWLTVNATSGIAPDTLAFSTTSLTDSLAPGTYSAKVYLSVSGYADLPVPISLLVTNKVPKLTISSANPVAITWTLGTAAPTTTITALSSDSPIPYTITTGGILAPIVRASQQSGLAYSFGTEIGITFNPLVFATAQPGTVLTGTVTFTWGSPVSTTVVAINVTVASPGATLTGLSPASLPTSAAGTTFQVDVTGTGFVGGTDPTLATKVGIVVGGVIVADTNFSANVVNASHIILTITVPSAADPLLPFAPGGVSGVVGGPVLIGLCNGTCTTPTGTATLTIGGGPMIQGVTSSSSFTEVTAPTLPTIAPYDMISIWGSNFCSSLGTGCGTTTVLSGTPDSLTLRYPLFLTPDPPPVPPAASTQRLLSVTFTAHGAPATVIGTAPLLFATNGQINAIVPAAVGVSPYLGATVDIYVNFGCASCTPSTLQKSSPFTVNIAASDPGVFTIGSDGQGTAAALSTSWTLINNTNPAGVRSGGSDSDTIQLYVTGLGLPTSTGSDLTTGSGCIAPVVASGSGSYEAALQTATSVSPALTNIDGAVIQSALLLSGDLPPCLTTHPTVTIGGVAGTVSYAGFVANTVAGLYQINVQLPISTATFYPYYPLTSSPLTGITAPVQLPVQITVGSGTPSQSGATIWVAPQLAVAAPSVLSGTVGIPWSSSSPANSVVASPSEGTAPFHYAVTSGVLPAGLSLNAVSGAIVGTPGANSGGSYVVTVTATDSASIPVTGTVSFTLVIAADLYITAGGANTVGTFGTAATLTPAPIPTGGIAPYAFTATVSEPSPGSALPAGMTVNATTGRVGISTLTPAGTYTVTVAATDSTSGTALTGSITSSVVVNLEMVTTAGSGSTLKTVTATSGNSAGTIQYSLDATSVAAGLLIDGSGNITAGTASTGSHTVTVTATDSGTLPTGASAFGTGTAGPFSVTVP